MSQLKRKLHLKLGEILFAKFEAGCRDSSKDAARKFLGVFGSRVSLMRQVGRFWAGKCAVVDRDSRKVSI